MKNEITPDSQKESSENENFFSSEDLRVKDSNEQSEDNLRKNKAIFKKTLLIFGLFLLLTSGYFLGYEKGKRAPAKEKNVSLEQAVIENKTSSLVPQNVDFSLFWKVWSLLKEKHVDRDEIDAQQIIYGAIKGMLKATKDPYTNFFDPKESAMFSQEIEGSFEGIGAELGIKDNILTVIAPLDGSPAKQAGLRSGDKIIKIDEKITSDITIDEAVDLIRGPRGSQLKLTVLSEGEQETKEITITRDTITLHSVKLEFKENGIAYVQIVQFSQNTDKEFSDAMERIIAQKSTGIILDLRGDPGGLLDKAVSIASRMIPVDQTVVIEEDSTGKRDAIKTLGGDKLSSIPTVVLIDKGSASASEILSSALRDNRGVTLIGEQSFGKGSVQQFIDLPGGSSVKITIAKWLTPSGDYIMKKGITPDVIVKMTLDDYKNNRDPQLDKAIEIIRSEIKNKK